MNRDSLNNRLQEIEQELAELEKDIKTANSEEEKEIRKRQEELSKEKEKLDEQLNNLLVKENSKYIIGRCKASDIKKRIEQNEVAIKQLKERSNAASGDVKKEIEGEIRFLGEQNVDLQKLYDAVVELGRVSKDSKIGKKERRKEIKRLSTDINKIKRNIQNSGSFGDIVSNLFGQIDRRVNNLVAKNNKVSKFFEKYQQKRYESPLGYMLPRAAGASLVILVGAISLSFVGGGLPLYSMMAATYLGAIVLPKGITAAVRRYKIKEPPKIQKVELDKGSYLGNIKNAIKRFKHVRDLKNNIPLVIDNNIEAIGSTTNSDESTNVDKTTDSIVDKKDKTNKPNIDLLITKLCELVGKLDINNPDKDKIEMIDAIYDRIQSLYGDDGLKTIPENVHNKYQEYKEALNKPKARDTEEERVVNKNSYIEALLQEMYSFSLELNRDSYEKCGRLLDEVNKNIPNDHPLRSDNSCQKYWNKYNYLNGKYSELNKIFTMIDKVGSLDIKNIDVEKFWECFEIHSNFTDEEFNDFKNIDPNIFKKWCSVLKGSHSLMLARNIEKVDVDKCISENNYEPIIRVVKIAKSLTDSAREKRKSNPCNDLSEEHKQKLSYMEDIVNKISKVNDFKINVNLEVSRSDQSIVACFKGYNGEEIRHSLNTKYDGNINEKTVIDEIISINPRIDRSKINIVGTNFVEKETSKGSHR